MPKKEHEYAFDVNLAAVVRVKATSEKKAREAMEQVLDAAAPTGPFLDGFNSVSPVQLTEFSLDAQHPNLFEIDGKKAMSKDNCDHRETAGGFCLDCGHDADGEEFAEEDDPTDA